MTETLSFTELFAQAGKYMVILNNLKQLEKGLMFFKGAELDKLKLAANQLNIISESVSWKNDEAEAIWLADLTEVISTLREMAFSVITKLDDEMLQRIMPFVDEDLAAEYEAWGEREPPAKPDWLGWFGLA